MEEPDYKPPPANVGTAPFSVLAGLFEKLAVERKHDRRRRLLEAWFSVRLLEHSLLKLL
jgi:DNA ligase-4